MVARTNIDDLTQLSASPGLRALRRALGRIQSSETAAGLAFLSPALLSLLFLRIYPTISAISASFHHASLLLGGSSRWVGLENYRFLAGSPTFGRSVLTTLEFVAATVCIQTVLALGIAVLFTQQVRGERLWRALVFLPTTIPVAVSTVVWGIAFRPDGVLNAVLGALGIARQPFLTSSQQALLSIIVLVSWVGVGYWTIFLIAGLREIPTEYREAAAVDGAGPARTFFGIVLPLLRRPLAFVIVANTIANFLVFAPSQILTRGGPANATRVVLYDIYSQAYQVGDRGLASAEIVLLMVILLAIVTVQFRFLLSESR
jgi:multiple sugar transport system permease protein